MNISVRDTTLFAVFHPDAQDLYNTCSDLKKVAWGLWDPNKRLGDEVGRPLRISRILPTPRRVKGCTCFGLSPPCFVGDLPNSRKVSKKCKEKPSSSKKNSTENACNCTSAATNSSIVPGGCMNAWVLFRHLIGLQEGKGLYIPLRRTRGCRQLDTLHHFRL
jgi:hypothetical protein